MIGIRCHEYLPPVDIISIESMNMLVAFLFSMAVAAFIITVWTVRILANLPEAVFAERDRESRIRLRKAERQS